MSVVSLSVVMTSAPSRSLSSSALAMTPSRAHGGHVLTLAGPSELSGTDGRRPGTAGHCQAPGGSVGDMSAARWVARVAVPILVLGQLLVATPAQAGPTPWRFTSTVSTSFSVSPSSMAAGVVYC